MAEILRPNDPYARPINATRPEGQMLVGEFYGKRADDKALSHETHGRQVSPANRFSGRGSATPVDMDAPPAPKPKRRREPKVDDTEVVAVVEMTPITEDDLFG